MIDKKLFISIIIANHNWSKFLENCLRSIYKSDYKNFEVIVVDDASTDNSIKVAKRFPCKVIELEKNIGQGFARNIGVDNSKGEIIFFIDSDTELHPKALEIINEDFLNEDVDAVIGIVDKNPLKNTRTDEYMCLESYYLVLNTKEKYSSFFTALVGAIKKDLFNKLGQFKHSWMDDFEFNNRLPTNTKILIDKRLSIRHNYNNFFRTFKKFFKRSSVWINLQDKKIDKTYYNFPRALGVGFSLLTLLSLLASIFLYIFSKQILFFIIPLIFFILFLIMNVNFLSFIFKEKRFLFTIYSIFYKFSFSLAIALGSIFGKIK